MIILYAFVFIFGLLGLYKLLSNELPTLVPWRTRLRRDIQIIDEAPSTAVIRIKEEPIAPSPAVHTTLEFLDAAQDKITRLEEILSEKNREIARLTLEMRAQNVRREDFDKLRGLMEEEIHNLRRQNRALKSELGHLPVVHVNVNS